MGLISASPAGRVALSALCALATAAGAGAQPAVADIAINGITAGQCTVTVTVSNPPAHPMSEVDLDLNGLWLARQTIANRRELTFRLKAPLEHLDEVRIREAGPLRLGNWSAPVVVQPGTGGLECRPPKQQTDDTRDPFRATFYVGAAFDNFAPASVGGYTTTPGGYLNPDKGGTSSTRSVAGVDFEFRAVGDDQSARQLWLVGGTLHGVRSGDVDCTAAPNDRPPICQTLGTQFGVQNPSAAFLYALEHASSFEAYLIPRWEFATLQPGTIFPSRAYVSFRMGVDMLSGDAHEAADFYHLGVGILTPSGPFRDSYIEAGLGRTDRFFVQGDRNKWHRLKFDALLSFPVLQAFTDRARFWRKAPRAYVELYSDFDPTGPESDSVQTFVGLDFDVGELFK